MESDRKPLGYVTAIVRFPIYEGEEENEAFDWFEFRLPGVDRNSGVGICMRECETLDAQVSWEDKRRARQESYKT